MTIETLSQSQAAALAGVTTRRLRQMTHEKNPPPQMQSGRYPAGEFARWLADTRRVPAKTEAEIEAELMGTQMGFAHEVLSHFCAHLLDGDPRATFTALCVHRGLSKRDALHAYAALALTLGVAGESFLETGPDGFKLVLAPDTFVREVAKAFREGTIDALIAQRWPDSPADDSPTSPQRPKARKRK